eukprot:1325305-Prymnesium_polylepis.2
MGGQPKASWSTFPMRPDLQACVVYGCAHSAPALQPVWSTGGRTQTAQPKGWDHGWDCAAQGLGPRLARLVGPRLAPREQLELEAEALACQRAHPAPRLSGAGAGAHRPT